MDTISRDNNSSILPVAGVIVGVVALVLSAIALVKVSSANRLLAEHDAKVQKIEAIESQVTTVGSTADKAARDLVGLKNATQEAVNQMTVMIGDVKASIVKIEESQKRPAARAGASKEPVVAGPGEYVVKAGESGAKIARSHGVSLSDLQAVNPGVNWNKLSVGQKIKLPEKK